MQSIAATQQLEQLGQLIKQHRTEFYSQAEFAERLGVSRKTLAALEDGKGGKLSTLCEALVILEIDTPFTELALELTEDVSDGPLRQRKRRKQPELDNDF